MLREENDDLEEKINNLKDENNFFYIRLFQLEYDIKRDGNKIDEFEREI